MNNEIVTLKNLWTGYNHNKRRSKVAILQDINLAIKDLDFVGVIGPNGGGKTTLIKVLLGLIKPWQGEVKIMGKCVRKGRQHIGYVPQVFEFDRHFPIRVEEVVLTGRLGIKKSFWKRYDRNDFYVAHRTLEQLGMFNYRNSSMAELSGGQRQRVYIARALATKPQILLLDEPTANVDPQSQNNIYEILKVLNESVTIILISHDLEGINNYIKTVACLNRRLLYHGNKFVSPQLLSKNWN